VRSAYDLETQRPENWRAKSRCKDDPERQFPGDKDPAGIERARAVCRLCPVADECLADALQRREPFGVWGGLSEFERRMVLQSVPQLLCEDCGSGFWPARPPRQRRCTWCAKLRSAP
jgi:WhiB family redox-sensing transcriptional regulator